MLSKLAISFTALAGLALGGIHVHPDDPYAALAATATSYEDWAIRIAAVATTGGEPAPSPAVSPAEQEAMEHLLNGTVAGKSCSDVSKSPIARPIVPTQVHQVYRDKTSC